MVSKVRVEQLETLDGLNTKNVATLVDNLSTAAVTTEFGTEAVEGGLENRLFRVKTLTDLKAVDTSALTDGNGVVVTSTERAGIFKWVAGDVSAEVAQDPQEGVRVAPDSDATGASGAWYRIYNRLIPEFFGASSDAVDNSTALQAQLDFSIVDNTPMYIPRGSYSFSTGLSVNVSGSVTIIGEDKFESRLVYTSNTGNAVDITADGFQGFSFALIKGGGAATSGGALRVYAERPSLENVLVNSEGGTDSWADFFVSIGGSESFLKNCHLLGANPQQSDLHGVVYDSGDKSVSHEAVGNIIYNCDRGYYIRNSSSPGAEGFRIFGGEVVNVKVGLDARNTSGYTPPMINMSNFHINSSEECVYVVGYQNVNVQGGLFYGQGNSIFYIENTTDFRCNGLSMVDQGGPNNQVGFTFTGDVFVIDTSNNYYSATGSAATWAFYNNVGTVQYATVANNKFNANGSWQTSRDIWVGGTQPTTYTHTGNIPAVSSDIRQTVNQSGGVVDVTQTRAKVINLGNVTGSTIITTFTGVSDGRIIVVQCDVDGVTIQHNANLRLLPPSNFTMGIGEKISLVNNLDGSWEEINRATRVYP